MDLPIELQVQIYSTDFDTLKLSQVTSKCTRSMMRPQFLKSIKLRDPTVTDLLNYIQKHPRNFFACVTGYYSQSTFLKLQSGEYDEDTAEDDRFISVKISFYHNKKWSYTENSLFFPFLDSQQPDIDSYYWDPQKFEYSYSDIGYFYIHQASIRYIEYFEFDLLTIYSFYLSLRIDPNLVLKDILLKIDSILGLPQIEFKFNYLLMNCSYLKLVSIEDEVQDLPPITSSIISPSLNLHMVTSSEFYGDLLKEYFNDRSRKV